MQLALELERHRSHLRAVAYRMLGSLGEAEDAVQETWLRASRAADSGIDNPRSWLTTIVSRVCFDTLRARQRRREDVTEPELIEQSAAEGGDAHAWHDVQLAEAIGRALLVVLDRLGPAERVAFVLHDVFGLPFETIARVVDRTPATTKKLASRARRRVQHEHADVSVISDHADPRALAEAFLAATRAGDVEGLVVLLAPDVVRSADRFALRRGAPTQVRGARRVAQETTSNAGLARHARVVKVDGQLGIAVAPLGRLRFVLQLTIAAGRISRFEVIGDPARLATLTVSELPP